MGDMRWLSTKVQGRRAVYGEAGPARHVRGTPVAVLRGKEDKVLPWACAKSLIEALGDPHVVTVEGDHAWLIGDPDRFVEVLTNVLGLIDGADGPDRGKAA